MLGDLGWQVVFSCLFRCECTVCGAANTSPLLACDNRLQDVPEKYKIYSNRLAPCVEGDLLEMPHTISTRLCLPVPAGKIHRGASQCRPCSDRRRACSSCSQALVEATKAIKENRSWQPGWAFAGTCAASEHAQVQGLLSSRPCGLGVRTSREQVVVFASRRGRMVHGPLRMEYYQEALEMFEKGLEKESGAQGNSFQLSFRPRSRKGQATRTWSPGRKKPETSAISSSRTPSTGFCVFAIR